MTRSSTFLSLASPARAAAAEAGQPGKAQAGGGELAQRPPQQSRVMREAVFTPEEVRSARGRPVWYPEDVTRPVQRLHSAYLGSANRALRNSNRVGD
jgi:hypothetical protein